MFLNLCYGNDGGGEDDLWSGVAAIVHYAIGSGGDDGGGVL